MTRQERRILLPLVAGVLLAFGVALGGLGGGPAVHPPDRAAVVPEIPRRPSDRQRARVQVPPGRREPPTEVTASRISIDARSARAPGGSGQLTARVLAHASDRLRPGVELALVPLAFRGEPGFRLLCSDASPEHPEAWEWAAGVGSRGRTDERGECDFPSPDQTCVLVALDGQDVMRRSVQAGFRGTVVLRRLKAPPPRFRVQVLDALGRGAGGVEVSAVRAPFLANPERVLASAESAQTGEVGLAVLGFRPEDIGPSPSGESRIAIRLELPLIGHWEEPLPLEPAEPHVVGLPPTGELCVHLPQHPEGELSWVQVRALGQRPEWAEAHRLSSRVDGRGDVLFERVPAGLELFVSGTSRVLDGIESLSVAGPGPGERLELSLDSAPPHLLRGLWSFDGAEPDLERTTYTLVRADGERSTGSPGYRDGFSIAFPPDDPGAPLVAIELRALESGRGERPARVFTGWARLPAKIPAGVTDLGTIRLRPLEPALWGRVIDAQGRPVEDVAVWLVGAGGEPALPPGESWRDDEVCDRTDADGRFSLALPVLPPGELHLMASAGLGGPFDLGAQARVLPGQGQYELVLAPEGSLQITLAAPGGRARQDLEVVLEPASSARGRLGGGLSRSFDSSGRLELQLPPGRWRCRFRARGPQRDLLAVDEVLVLSGELSADPRLQGLDLSGELQVVRLRLVDDSGRTIDRGVRVLANQGGEPWWEVRKPRASEEWQLIGARDEAFELDIAGKRYRPERIAGVTHDLELELRPKLRVYLRLDLKLPLGNGGWPCIDELQCLAADGSVLRRVPNPDGRIGANQRVLLRFDQPGRWRTVWSLALPSGERVRTGTPGPSIEVPEGEDEGAVEVELPAVLLAP